MAFKEQHPQKPSTQTPAPQPLLMERRGAEAPPVGRVDVSEPQQVRGSLNFEFGASIIKNEMCGASITKIEMCGASIIKHEMCGASITKNEMREASITKSEMCGTSIIKV